MVPGLLVGVHTDTDTMCASNEHAHHKYTVFKEFWCVATLQFGNAWTNFASLHTTQSVRQRQSTASECVSAHFVTVRCNAMRLGVCVYIHRHRRGATIWAQRTCSVYIYMCCVYPLSLQFLVRIDCLRSFVIGLHIYIYICSVSIDQSIRHQSVRTRILPLHNGMQCKVGAVNQTVSRLADWKGFFGRSLARAPGASTHIYWITLY